MRSGCMVLALFCSFSALARVSIEEKQNRVEFIEGIATVAPSVSVEAYRRELEYEKQGLSLEERAKKEAGLLAEAIRGQVVRAYEAELQKLGSAEEAEAKIKELITSDLKLASPEIRDELLRLSLQTIEEAKRGGMSSEAELESIEKLMLENVEARAEYLNQDVEEAVSANCPGGCPDNAAFVPSGNGNKDSEKTEYKSKAELLESLASDRESTRWVLSSNYNATHGQQTSYASKVSLQVKFEFLGVTVEGGPSLSFKRTYSTAVNLLADGLDVPLLNDGNFDFVKRDRSGKVIMKKGKPVRRYVAFYCSTDLNFSTEVAAGGTLKFMGAGGETSASSSYSNAVTINSRRIQVPEYVAGKSVTIQYLSGLCHRDFLRTKVNDRMTVEGSLDQMMKNMVAGLRYSHARTKCAADSHCINWFNREIGAIFTYDNYPRCVPDRETFRACALRGLKGQNCAVYNREGERISSGMFEYKCDTGLRCVQTQEAGWFINWEIYQPAKGKCMPINPRTYRDPREKDYIEVYLVN